MTETTVKVLEWIIMIGTSICAILAIIISITLIREIRKLANSKVIVYTYRIGQRPNTFDIKEFKYTYITVEKMGVIVFVYSTGKKYKHSIFKTESIDSLLDKIEAT